MVGLLGTPPKQKKIGEKLAQTWDILAPYITGPVDAFWRLAQSPAASGGAFTEQNAADALTAGGGPIAAGSVVPKPRNALNMGVKLWHGSPEKNLKELRPDSAGTGALGPGVYGTPAQNVAQRYGENVYSFEAPDEMFLGSGNRWDDIPSNVSQYQVWRDQIEKLAAANPEHADIIRTAGAKMTYDGYPFFRELAYRLGSKEKAQEVYKKAGFKGLTAMVDGPEAVLFDSVPLGATEWLRQGGI